MNKISFSLLMVFLFTLLDVNIATAYNPSKIKIYKVINVAKNDTLNMRAWPSSTSRIVVALKYNAKNLIETGKSKVIGQSKWLEITWRNKRGWVNRYFLKKTGVLLHSNRKSRNLNSTTQIPIKTPSETSGNRYTHLGAQPTTNIETAYSKNRQKNNNNNGALSCSGNSPDPWSLRLNISNRSMQIKTKGMGAFSLPISYHTWASPNEVRISLGGNKGRNAVDINIEKTNACNNGLTNKNFPYRVNATINRDFFSGCCQPIR